MASSPISPTHYSRLSPEPIDVIRYWSLSFNIGCVLKYVVRAGHKDPDKHVEDLEKARAYLDHEIAAVKADLLESA